MTLDGEKEGLPGKELPAQGAEPPPPPAIAAPSESAEDPGDPAQPAPLTGLKVSCILVSYNRPKWVRQAIKSIVDQTHKNYQLVLIDESSIFDIYDVAKEFDLTDVVIRKYNISAGQRKGQNRLSINLNVGLALATGDLVCFLADDDYYYPGWFEAASRFFEARPEIKAAYGKLCYSNTDHMEFNESPAPVNLRFFAGPLTDPFNKLDHNQVIHRRFPSPYRWPEDLGLIGGPDAYYFREVAKHQAFHPINAWAAVKRVHKKNLQISLNAYFDGSIGGARE